MPGATRRGVSPKTVWDWLRVLRHCEYVIIKRCYTDTGMTSEKCSPPMDGWWTPTQMCHCESWRARYVECQELMEKLMRMKDESKIVCRTFTERLFYFQTRVIYEAMAEGCSYI